MVTVKFGNWSLGFGSKNKMRKRPLALVILDGWGYSNRREGNAIALARTPNYDQICANFPRTYLSASGARVGLTPNDPGNSEVGHLSLGAGRVILSPRAKISSAIESGEFFQNAVLKQAFGKSREKNSDVHLIGLLSDGKVHSCFDTLFSLLRMAKREGVGENVYVHGILDGRDVERFTADVYTEAVQIKMADIGCGRIATLCGRHYAMDKSGDWARTARVFTMLVHSEGERAFDAVSAIRGSFLRRKTDEFIQPIVLEKRDGTPVAKIKDGDTVIFFNHRPDRMRQLVRALCAIDKKGGAIGKPKINAVCITEYDKSFGLPAAFRSGEKTNVLAKVFADNEVSNCRLTESEKYDHITYFFNGGAKNEYPGEKRIVVASKDSAHGNIQAELGCFMVTDKLLRELETRENDVFIVNLAAADMIAHTGSLDKTIEAVQCIDICLGGIVNKIQQVDGVALITSDHGNCEEMTNGKTNSHTSNPVPFHLIANDLNGTRLRAGGALEDVAPTILGILGIKKPHEMTGNDLRIP